MDGRDFLSRRHFLQGSGAAAGSTLARLSWPTALAAAQAACSARDEAAAFSTLTAGEARDIEAFSSRILPTTTTPGAREAGVVYFFDKILGSQMSGMLDGVRATLVAFQAGIPERFPGAETLADLKEADQDAWIEANENTPFFSMGRMLTIMGFFAMSKYGGNRNNVAWDLIGFEPHGSAQPPYGFYDAQYLEEKPNGD